MSGQGGSGDYWMRMASVPPGPPEPIFVGDVPDVVPGELIVRVRGDVAAQITASIPSGPSRGAPIGPSAFGVETFDALVDELGITSITHLHPPTSPVDAAMTSAVQMASTFRVRYENDVDVEEAAGRFDGIDGVEFVEPNRYRETYQVTPNDPSFAAQWGLTRINCPAAWSRGTGSPNVTVAVIDTGVDLDHPELAGLLIAGRDLVDLGTNPIPPPGFRFEGDFAGRDSDPQDDVGHGTHVAGTIACLSNNNTGVAGVTWGCRLMPVRVLARIVNVNNPNDVRGVGSAADIAAGIRWAVDHGARILNLSLGGTTDTQVERDAIAYAIGRGVIVVAAMGNAFNQGNPTSYPAAYPDVIAVGAIAPSDQRAGFSQTGPHIDVVAPGVGVLSTVWDNGYATFNGTSMATPHVAGVAALILSCNTGLTAAQVGDIIRQTAQPLRDNPGDPVPNNNYGFGCVDAEAAVNRACPIRPSRPIFTCPTWNVRCRSRVILCPTETLRCPSVAIRCPSETFLCPTETFRCPSVAIRCPSEMIRCPSVTIRCPSEIFCGIEPPIQRGRPGFEWDPYAEGIEDPYGQLPEDWESYDPYSVWYGEDW